MLIRRIRCSMDTHSVPPSRQRIRERQALLAIRGRLARHAMKKFIILSYTRAFAWIGSVEPCTGVLCETCQRCLRDRLILNVRKGTGHTDAIHHATASSMFAAVETGCRICTCLWRQFAGVENFDPENVPREIDEQMREFSTFCSYSVLPYSPLSLTFGVHTFGVQGVGIHFQQWDIEPLAVLDEKVPRIDLSSLQNDRIDLMNQSWSLVKGWLSECSSHHTRCKHVTSVEDYYPTRLIDVRVNNRDCELRLYSTSNGPIKEPYMTLSHCWGKAQFLRLTSLTHDRFHQGFTFAELPPTFQDAVMVTRALGVNFLWIDALCIIQDSDADWQHEATMMSQVYSNSICNISALDAQDSTGGLFFDRETSNIPYCTVTARRKFKRKRVYQCAYTHFWSDSVQYAPLTRRAWVLQERLLAPRVLHFGKRQLLWECNELRACELWPAGMRAPHSPFSGDAKSNMFSEGFGGEKFSKDLFATILQGGSDDALYSLRKDATWNDLVEYYTKCNLTMSKDKLVAISGIVKRLQPLFKTEYLAGLWRDDLLRQLLWHVEFHEERRRPLAGEKRPEYRAPSWSWASIDAPIGQPQLNAEVVHMATIIEAHVTPVTEDATGQVADGYVRLRAPLFPVNIDTSAHHYYPDLSWDWGKLESINEIIPDIWPRSAVERLQFAPLLTQSLYNDGALSLEIYGLILSPVEGKQGVSQRWGRANFFSQQGTDFLKFGVQLMNDGWTYKYDPPERYPEQTITLI